MKIPFRANSVLPSPLFIPEPNAEFTIEIGTYCNEIQQFYPRQSICEVNQPRLTKYPQSSISSSRDDGGGGGRSFSFVASFRLGKTRVSFSFNPNDQARPKLDITKEP